MAYDPTNPPRAITAPMGSQSTLWVYSSTDNAAAVGATDYFSNGYDLGMRVNDNVIVNDTDGPLATLHIVSAVTEGGAATVT